MYSFLIKLFSILSYPQRFFGEHSLVVLSKLLVKKGNLLKTERSIIRKSRISVKGNNNIIEFGNADIFNSIISIIGSNNTIRIHNDVRIYNMAITINKSHGCIIEIGEATHMGGGTVLCAGDSNSIIIGRNCMIAEGVDIWNSDTHIITINGEEIRNSKPISIHDHVWLGKGVTVLKGVTIGENSIVGMKSIVTHSIRPGTINAGSPSRELSDKANWRK